MKAKVVHDDINAGGGSERLAIITMDLLQEMGFKVDLASFNKPNIEELKEDFGDIVDSIDINPVSLDLLSLLGMNGSSSNSSSISHNIFRTKKDTQGDSNIDKMDLVNTYSNDKDYDLIINTHGDLLPYYNKMDNSSKINKKGIVTYCHFPLVPQLIQQDNNSEQYMRFLKKWIKVDRVEQELTEMILENVSKTYDLMMRESTVLTNSNFSRRAIEQHYGPTVKPIILYPPVDVEKFRKIALRPTDRENMILVVSRFSPDKQLENAVEIGNILVNEIKLEAKIILVGNITSENQQYLKELRRLIEKYHLGDSITIEVGIGFEQLLEMMRKSKVYLHPLAGEPFGISIVEAMSAGLIPVVPDEGGYTEFVPDYYQFHTHQQAADIIGKILIASDNDMQAERTQLSESVSRFSTETYKASLRKVIESLLSSK